MPTTATLAPPTEDPCADLQPVSEETPEEIAPPTPDRFWLTQTDTGIEHVPGFHLDVPEADYHSDAGASVRSLSHSGMKTIAQRSLAHFLHEREHPTGPTDAMARGSILHAIVLSGGAPDALEGIAAISPYKEFRTDASKEWKAAQEAAGLIVVKPAALEPYYAMAHKVAAHEMASRLLAAAPAREVTAYVRDETTAVMLRCRYDALGEKVRVPGQRGRASAAGALGLDYKTAVSADPEVFVKKAYDLGYHQQQAAYEDIALVLGNPIARADGGAGFYFVVQESESPYVVTVIELPEDLVALGRVQNRAALTAYAAATSTGAWPGYIASTQIARPAIPEYLRRKAREEAA